MTLIRVLSVCLLALVLVGCVGGGACDHRLYYLTDEVDVTLEE